jgi:hypothetical protein
MSGSQMALASSGERTVPREVELKDILDATHLLNSAGTVLRSPAT